MGIYEAVPWKGDMKWKVDTWGYWRMTGRNTFRTIKQTPTTSSTSTGSDFNEVERISPTTSTLFEVDAVFTCDPEVTKGLKFRAPTPEFGMVYFCRNTFDAEVTLSLWELQYDH